MPKRYHDELVKCGMTDEERERFSIIVSDRAISKLVASEMSEEDKLKLERKDADGVYEAMSNMRDQEIDTTESILIGELHKVYVDCMKKNITGAAMIADNGSHMCCRENCVIVPVYGKPGFSTQDECIFVSQSVLHQRCFTEDDKKRCLKCCIAASLAVSLTFVHRLHAIL